MFELLPTVRIATKNNLKLSLVPRQKIGVFFDLDLLQISGSQQQFQNCAGGEEIFELGTSRRVGGLIPRSARPVPSLRGRKTHLRLAEKRKSNRIKSGPHKIRPKLTTLP